MTVAAVCLSHTPLMGRASPAADVAVDVEAALDEARRFVQAFAPDVVVCVAPDHLNGFLYRMMPQLCVGTAATAIGDFDTPAGRLRVPEELARGCIEAFLAADVDVAVSHDMQVDHAFAQPLHLLTGALDAVPVVPVFVNAAAPPRVPLRRARTYGRVLGEWAAGLDRRVLLVGSGGLSHDPPTPSWAGADGDLQRRLLDGMTADAREAREAGVDEIARAFAAGGTELRALAPEFDAAFLRAVETGRLDAVDDWDDGWLTDQAGRAVHEIRSWVVVCNALEAAGAYDVRSSFYRPIAEWLVGFGVLLAGGRQPEVVG